MGSLTLRPATRTDVEGLHPEANGCSYRAWAGEIDGKQVGVIGLVFTRPRTCLFCRFDEAARPYLKSMTALRMLKKVKTLIEDRGLPVYAVQEPGEDKAPAILKRMGFEFTEEIAGSRIWEWEPN